MLELQPEDWVIYRAHDKTEPEGNSAQYFSRMIAGVMRQIDEWEREMPARYHSWTGLRNADAEDIQEMRNRVAREFQAWAASLPQSPIQPPK